MKTHLRTIMAVAVIALVSRVKGDEALYGPTFVTLPPGYGVAWSADSLEALQGKAKPTLILPGGDYLWITKTAAGERIFSQARPYVMGKPAGPMQAVILETKGPSTLRQYSAISNATLDRKVEAAKADGRSQGYATVLSMDPVAGTLYQIGFPFQRWEDHKTLAENRVLVMHDPAHGWRVVSVFPVVGTGLYGNLQDPVTVATHVRWIKDADMPVRVGVTITSSAPLTDGSVLQTARDTFCGESQELCGVARPYVVMQNGDSLSRIAGHLAERTGKPDGGQNARQALLLEAIAKLNPDLNARRILVGTRVTIPEFQEAMELAQAKKKLDQVYPLPVFDLEEMAAATPEEAALLGIMLDSGNGMGAANLDTPVMLAQFKKSMQERKPANEYDENCQLDLNEDALPERVYANGEKVFVDGTHENMDGVTGNHSFAIVGQLKSGRWRLVLQSMGTGPYPLESRSQGWKDLEVGWHMSAAERVVHFYQFDGTQYVEKWAASTLCPEGTVSFSATPVPAGLAEQAAASLKLTGGLSGISAVTFDATIKGNTYVLLALQGMSLDGKSLNVAEQRANLFLFRKTKDGYQPLLAEKNNGSIPFPEWDEAGGKLVFTVGDRETHHADNHLDLHEVTVPLR